MNLNNVPVEVPPIPASKVIIKVGRVVFVGKWIRVSSYSGDGLKSNILPLFVIKRNSEIVFESNRLDLQRAKRKGSLDEILLDDGLQQPFYDFRKLFALENPTDDDIRTAGFTGYTINRV